MGDKKCTAGGTTRLRLSTWVNFATETFNSNTNQPNNDEGLLHFNKWLVAKNQNKLNDPATRAALGHRIRDAKGILDDFSLIKTIFLTDLKGGVNWHRTDRAVKKDAQCNEVLDNGQPVIVKVDDGFLPGAGSNDQLRQEYCQYLIDLCHEQGVQILAGYGVGDEGKCQQRFLGQRFVQFINQAKNNPQLLTTHAQNIASFLYDQQKLDFDGVSFDLEINGLGATHADTVVQFYDVLAKEMKKRGRMIAVATGIGVDKNTSPFGVVEQAIGTFMAQPFRLAKNNDNAIVRAMAYDAGINDETNLREWHQAVVKFARTKAFGNKGLKPGQFQLGITLSGDSAVKTKANIEFRCRDILRCEQVGLVIFALTSKKAIKDQFDFMNAALNEKAPPSGTLGQPVQVPLDKAAISRFNNAGFKTKAVTP